MTRQGPGNSSNSVFRRRNLTQTSCRQCARLNLTCYWHNGSNNTNILFDVAGTGETASTGNLKVHITGYDDPSVLQGSATSVIRTVDDKQTFQYLCEKGSTILRYPTQLLPARSTINPFTLGFQMARHHPTQVKAYLALGAAHRSQAQPDGHVVAVKHYSDVVSGLRSKLLSNRSNPEEWMCAVAALLCMYEVCLLITYSYEYTLTYGHSLLCLPPQSIV